MSGNSPLGALGTPTASPGNTYPQSGGSNVVGFLQQLLGGLSQANDQRQDRELKKTQVGEIQRNAAQQQLDKLTAIAQSDPSKQSDPAFQAQVKKYSDVAMPGIKTTKQVTSEDNPNAGTTSASTPNPDGSINGKAVPTPDTPGIPALNKQPTLARETLDMDVLAPRKDINSLSPDEKDKVLATPRGPLRDKLLDGYSGVDKSWHDAPTLLSQQDKNQVHLDVRDFVNNVGSGKLGGAAASAALNTIKENALGAGMSIDGLIAEITDPSTLGPAIANKMAEATAAGLDKEALADYHRMLAIDTPARWKAQLLQGDTRNQIAGQRADTATANERSLEAYRSQQSATNALNAQTNFTNAQTKIAETDTNIDKNNTAALKANVASMTSILGSLNKQAADQAGVVKAMIAASQDPSDGGSNSAMSVLAGINKQINTLQSKISEAGSKIQAGPTQHVVTSSGNPSAKVGEQPPFKAPPGMTPEKRGDKWGVKDSSGTWYPYLGGK